jgi:hypothetical protein
VSLRTSYHFVIAVWRTKKTKSARVKYWETIADNLSKAGWTWGCLSQIDSNGRELFTADAPRSDGHRFIVQSDEKLTAFLELERMGEFTVPIVAWARSFSVASGTNSARFRPGRLAPMPILPKRSECHAPCDLTQQRHFSHALRITNQSGRDCFRFLLLEFSTDGG